MPRYFFHVVEGTYILSDDEGSELPDLEAVRNDAVEGAREIMADDIRSGRKPEDRTMLVRDENGITVLTLPFLDAIS